MTSLLRFFWWLTRGNIFFNLKVQPCVLIYTSAFSPNTMFNIFMSKNFIISNKSGQTWILLHLISHFFFYNESDSTYFFSSFLFSFFFLLFSTFVGQELMKHRLISLELCSSGWLWSPVSPIYPRSTRVIECWDYRLVSSWPAQIQ